MRGKGSLFFLLTGLLLYVFDVGSDIYVAITYFQKEDYWWFGITIALVILPGIIVNFSSLIVNLDISDKGGISQVLACVFQLFVIQQYCEALKRWKRMNWGIGAPQPCNEDNYDTCECKNCKRYFEKKKQCADYDRNLALTRYIEAFVESAPQWCLQFYIMLRQWSFPWITIASTVFSLLSMAWSITLVEKTGKIDNNPTMTFPKRSLIVFSLWQLGILVSRLSAIVIFAYVFRSYVFIVIGIHWTAVIVMIMINEYYGDDHDNWTTLVRAFFTSYPLLFHFSTFTRELMFNNFSKETMLNVIYCSIFFLENVIIVSFSVWYEPTSTPHIELLSKIVLPLVFVGFPIGLLFCGLYYKFFHPSKMEMDKIINEVKLISLSSFRAENNRNEIIAMKLDETVQYETAV